MDILYKYVTPELALKCIPEVGNCTLRATQPAALNDPFECAFLPRYNTRSDSEENAELANVLNAINGSNPITPERVGEVRNKYGSLVTRQLFSEQLSTRFGIVSFSTDPYHPLMWSHYTMDGSGFVIGYDAAQIAKLAGTKGHLQAVVYAQQLTPILGPNVLASPSSNLPKLLSCKSDHWSYENEWRFIVELNQTIGTGEIDDLHGQPINLVQIPNEAIVRVYYTERTRSNAAKSLESITSRLADKDNRYRARYPRRLIVSSKYYGYEEDPSNYQS